MNYIENNRTIDVFMNYKSRFSCSICEEGRTKRFTEIMPYHTSWKLLMEVVEKIESLKNLKEFEYFNAKEISFKLTKYSAGFVLLDDEAEIEGVSGFFNRKWATYGGTEKLNATFNAVCEFIQWYNDNKYKCPECGIIRTKDFPVSDETGDIYCPDCNTTLTEFFNQGGE